MLPRVAFLLGFLVTVFGTYFVLDKRDKPAGQRFSFTAPPDFHDTIEGVYFHGGEVDEEANYRELMTLDEGEGTFFPGEGARVQLYGKGSAIVGDETVMKVVESSVTRVGDAPVVFAKLQGKDKDDVEIQVYTWHYATDRGWATLRGFCLPSEATTYRPQFEAAARSAKGIAVRVERPEWWQVSAAGFGVGAVLWFALSRRFGAKKAPPKAPPPPDDADEDDDEDDEALPEKDGASKAASS